MKKATLNLLAKHLNPASRVVMRADFNVPLKDGVVKDVNRIKSTLYITQAPSLPSMNFLNTTPNLSSSFLTLEGPMERKTPNTLWDLSSSPSKRCLAVPWLSSRTVLVMRWIVQSPNPTEESSFVKMCDSTLKKRAQSRTPMAKRSRVNLRQLKPSESNCLNWVTSMWTTPSELPTVLTLAWSASITSSVWQVSWCRRN